MNSRLLRSCLSLPLLSVAVPPFRAADSPDAIRTAIAAHDRAVHVHDTWVRDPYITLGPDGCYYYTGTTQRPATPLTSETNYNTGLGGGSLVGWHVPVWRSSDLAVWEPLGVRYTLKDTVWYEAARESFDRTPPDQWRVWAPELHWRGDRWALIHTTPVPLAPKVGGTLVLSAGRELAGPWTSPLDTRIGRRHDPSLFKDDDGTWWMIWGATEIAPLKPDLSDYAGEPVRIGPSGETAKMGHEGCLMHKIGGKYVLFGTGWSTGKMRKGSYNLYYATADRITGPYSERKFVGRFLGHGTPFRDKQDRWWCTAFYNANVPPLPSAGITERDLGADAQTINEQGLTLVPLDVRVTDGEVVIRAKDPRYASPGPDEAQKFALAAAPAAPATSAPPNIILIVTDDMGYGDLGCQGARGFATPRLDRMAAEGTRFTSFYAAQAVCTASRAALLTGCYPNRVGLQGALNHTSREGIHDGEWLLPEMCRARGYATAGFGKWHLGTHAQFHPLRHGFDEWFGIPYSNDNSRYHPVLAAEMPPLPLYDGDRVVEQDPDQGQFTRRLTERAVAFIRRHAGRPFFLYLAHVMPHVPLFASERFRGRTSAGVYGDVMEELDWSVGEILDTLRALQLDRRTVVVFMSDNGPFLSYGSHAGSAGPLREGKLTAFEGGVRVPCIAWAPGRVPAQRVCAEPFMAIDWLPTFTDLIGGRAPTNRLDGRSVRPLLLGEPGARSPHDALFFYAGTELHAVRSGPWKLHFPHSYLTVRDEPAPPGKPAGWGRLAPRSISESGVEGIASRHGYRVAQLPLSLFDLAADPGERRDVAAAHPDVVARLGQLAGGMRSDLGDSLTNVNGSGRRPVGRAP